MSKLELVSVTSAETSDGDQMVYGVETFNRAETLDVHITDLSYDVRQRTYHHHPTLTTARANEINALRVAQGKGPLFARLGDQKVNVVQFDENSHLVKRILRRIGISDAGAR